MQGAGAHLFVPVSGASEEEISKDHAGGQAVHAHRLSSRCRLLVQAAHEMSNACTQTVSQMPVLKTSLASATVHDSVIASSQECAERTQGMGESGIHASRQLTSVSGADAD